MNAKKISALFLSCIMLLGGCITGVSAADEKLPFTDVPENEWYYGAVEFVYENGLMNGTGDGSKFSPTMNLTRGMVVTVLYRNERANQYEYYQHITNQFNGFVDAAEGAYYYLSPRLSPVFPR